MLSPLVVCKGIAKKFKLRCSGFRNWLGQTLLVRNEAWVNGTMPGLCVAFAGSNTDVQPNDRLPILPCTHEAQCGKQRCLVKKGHLKRTTRVTQRAQSVINGYFGGYIGKRQPAGAFELKKCVDKLFTLRTRYQGKGKAAQLRAASGRLITDLEMNSTYRGAVEIFNLCRNLHPYDVLFAECIRTFDEHTLDGRSWLYRLESSQLHKNLKEDSLQSYIPPTKKPNVRTDRSRANEFEAYGYRPLCHPWKFLSAYEFLRFWRMEPLLVPAYYKNRNVMPRTTWTQEGLAFSASAAYKKGEVSAKAGIHFVALEASDETYSLFPEEPEHIYKTFRHAWVLIRKKIPDVVVIEGLKMPSTARSAAYNAQYCSLFFRPWTLLEGDERVPNLGLLGLPQQQLAAHYGPALRCAAKVQRKNSGPPSLEHTCGGACAPFSCHARTRGNPPRNSNSSSNRAGGG
jgi:hypothetical protein